VANTVQLNLTVKDDGSFVLDKFVDTAKKGSTEAAKAASGASGSFSKMGASVVSVNAALELTQQVARLAGAAFDFIAGGAQKTGEEYLRLSQQTGLTVEEISSMSLAAATADVSQEALALSTKKLSINMVDAASGGKESSAAFAALGVEVKNSDGTLRSVNDVFLDTVDALGSIQNESERTAASQAVFGRSSIELAALIADGSGKIREQAELAAKLGLVWSGPAAQAADELGDQTTILKAALKGVSDEIGAKTIPSMTELASSTVDWIAANREAISLNIDRVFAAIAMEAGALEGAVDGVVGALSRLVGQVPGLSGLLATIKANVVEYYDLQNQAAAAAKATDEVGRAFIEQAAKTRAAKDALDEYKAAVGTGSTDDERAKLAELNTEYDREKAALDALQGSLSQHVTKTDQAASASAFLGQSLATMRDKAALSGAAIEQFAKVTGLSVDEVRALDAGAKPTAAQIEKLAKATGQTADQIQKALPGTKSFATGMKKAGDEAEKAAQRAAHLAEKLASVSAASAEYATQQVSLAGETGDLTAIQQAHDEAVQAVEKAYRDVTTAIQADAAAGADQALVETEQIRAAQQHTDGLRAVDDATRKATSATMMFGVQLDQIELAQLSLEADQAARRIQDLARAGVRGAVVNKVYAQATDALRAAHEKEIAAIEAEASAQKAALDPQRDAIKIQIIDKVAKEKGAEATDRYTQSLQQLLDQLNEIKSEDPLSTLSRKLDKSSEDIGNSLDDVLHGDKGFSDFVSELADTLLGANGPAGIIDAMGAAAEHGLRDLLKTTVNFGTDITKSLVNDVTEPITKGLQHLEGEIVKGIENLAEDAWDAITDLFGGGKSRAQQLAEQMGKAIGGSLTDDAVKGAVVAGAEAIGEYAGQSLVHAMAHLPVAELHKGIHDVVTEAFAGESAAVQTEIQQLAQAAGTAVAASLNYVGGEAIAFSQAWAASWIRAQVQAGKSAEQIIKALEAMDKSLGTSGGIFAALDALNAKILETGKSGEVFKDLNAIIKDWTGKKADVQSFSDVLAAFGGDAVLTLNAIKKSMEDNGIAVEQFGDDLGDVVLAFTGAGESIQAATEDYRKFGNEADGTAQILRDEVLRGLDDVIASAKDFPTESVQAFGSAVGMIPPEMLRSSEFTKKLRDDFAQMAAASHMSVRDLVNSIDPPLPDALKKAILSTNDLGKALGALSGAPLSSIKEVTDRMKQFAGDMYREVKDETGKTTKVLTAFGEQTVGDLVNAVGGMWDTITEDGVIATGEIDDVFHQIGMIPEEVFNDPAVQDAVHSLLAKIGEQTGDATLIALAASTTITKEQLDAATAQYDQWVKDHPPPPPPATTPTDGSTPTDGTTPGDTTAPAGGPADTSAASETPPPQPIPPETQKSWDDLTASAVEYAKAVTEGRDAVVGLATDAVTSAATMLAAFTPVYGTPNDERSLSAIRWLLTTLTDDFLGQSGNIADDFDKIRGAVNQLHTAVDDLSTAISDVPTDKTITFHIVQDGDIPPGGDDGGGGEGHAAGHWKVPGPVGQPFRTILHGGERVLSVEEDREYQRIRFGAGGAAAATAGPMAYVSPAGGSTSSGRAPSARAVAREVVRSLTSDGSVRWLGVPSTLSVDDLARFVVLEALPRYSSARLVTADPRTGVIRRDSSMPGRG